MFQSRAGAATLRHSPGTHAAPVAMGLQGWHSPGTAEQQSGEDWGLQGTVGGASRRSAGWCRAWSPQAARRVPDHCGIPSVVVFLLRLESLLCDGVSGVGLRPGCCSRTEARVTGCRVPSWPFLWFVRHLPA